jgi:hypothetical protein
MTLPALLAYTPFLSPLPIWDYWWVLLFPLVIGVAVAYKAIKCDAMHRVPRESASITFWILAGLGSAGVVLSLLVHFLER